MDIRRLILLCVFSFSLVLLWEAWQKYQTPAILPPTASAAGATVKDPSLPTPSLPATSVQPAAASGAVIPPVQAAKNGEIVKIKTDLFVAEISTQGGDVVGLSLEKYKDVENQKKDFELLGSQHQYFAQSGLLGDNLPNHRSVFSVVSTERELAADAKTLKLRLDAAAAGGVKVSKIYTFTRGSYLIDVTYEINNSSNKDIAAHAYYQLQRDTLSPSGETKMVSTFTGPAIYTEADKYQKINFSDVEKNKAKFNHKADNGWVAMVQHYFVAAWIPQEKVAREFYVKNIAGGTQAEVVAGLMIPTPVIAAGSKATQSVAFYAGPQFQSTLEQLAKPVSEGGIGAQGLPLVVDYGILTIVAAPIFWMLELIHKFVGNWGWAIILLTIGIKLIFFPLSAASYKSMARMRAVTPRLTALKERCGDDRMKLNQEMMKLYQAEKINPLGGCLPMVVQIPVFIALYWALLGAVEMRDAPWVGWIHDLSSPDPFYVLPVIMIVSMLIQTKLNPTPPDPLQAKVMMFMPFIFGGMFFFFPAGLVLYWVVNNILSIAQQWQITRMIESGGKAANDAKA